MEKINVKINDKIYHLLHLISEDEKERGLMGITELKDDEGALFDYSDEPQESIDFWMKDTLIPLDILFINESGKVISVQKGTPMSEELISESSEFIAYVIELNADSGINKGDETSLGKRTDVEPDKLYVYGSDGNVQATLQGNERIFSRASTKRIIELAERADQTKDDKDYKALGKYIFKEMSAQDAREPEYVEN